MAYCKVPLFQAISTMFEQVISFKNIAEANIFAIRSICKYLGVATEILISSKIQKNNHLKAQEKIIQICKVLSGTHYINAFGGRELYNRENFYKEGLELSFLKTGNAKYKQFNNDFVPNLSILDVMMFHSPEKINEMLNEYELLP
jgi:hypothetical protein